MFISESEETLQSLLYVLYLSVHDVATKVSREETDRFFIRLSNRFVKNLKEAEKNALTKEIKEVIVDSKHLNKTLN